MNSSVKFLWILKCHIYVFLSQAQLLWIKSQRVWLFIDRYGSACNSLLINWLRFGVEALESVYWMKNNGYAKYHLSFFCFPTLWRFCLYVRKASFLSWWGLNEQVGFFRPRQFSIKYVPRWFWWQRAVSGHHFRFDFSPSLLPWSFPLPFAYFTFSLYGFEKSFLCFVVRVERVSWFSCRRKIYRKFRLRAVLAIPLTTGNFRSSITSPNPSSHSHSLVVFTKSEKGLNIRSGLRSKFSMLEGVGDPDCDDDGCHSLNVTKY